VTIRKITKAATTDRDTSAQRGSRSGLAPARGPGSSRTSLRRAAGLPLTLPGAGIRSPGRW
jgi:hypothetical protein